MKDQRLQEAGLFLIVVAAPLVFFPISFAPYLDLKMVAVVSGSLLLWLGKPRIDRGIALAAGVWVAVAALAGLLGVDGWYSLMGTEGQAGGLILLATSAYLLTAGTGLSPEMAERIPRWLIAGVLTVSVAAAVLRLLPEGWSELPPGLSLADSTVGQKVIVDALAAAGIATVLGTRLRAWVVGVLTFLIASGIGSGGGRIGWMAAVAGIAVVALKSSHRRKGPLAACLIALVVAFAFWSLVATLSPAPGLGSSAREFTRLDEGSSRGRLFIYSAALKATIRRPVLGWGPGNTTSAWLHSATLEEAEEAGKRVSDAHNLFLESAVTTGIAGLAALLVLASLLAWRWRRGPPAVAWATGAATALFVYHLFQPLNVVATPLMFLLAGVACPRPNPADVDDRPSPVVRSVVGAALGLFLVLAVARTGASIFEQVGRSYFSPWSLEQSLRLEPKRASAAQALALSLALDGRGGDEQAAKHARALATRTVHQHPWHTVARLTAADVETLLRNEPGRLNWTRQQLERFPNDPAAREALGRS